MNKWWNWVLGAALFCLLFIAIPLTYSGDRNKEQMKSVFDEYIEKFNKSYKNNPDEYETKFQNFLVSLQEIDELNAESRGPDEHRARYGLTALSDMSKAEYREIHLSDERIRKPAHLYGKSWSKARSEAPVIYTVTEEPHSDHQRNRSCNEPHNNVYIVIRKKRAVLPMKVDWRTKGVVGPVRNQGLCGACWAFSTIGTMETMAAMSTGNLKMLSVQEVIDCAGLGNEGCAGGDICLLLDWLVLTGAPIEPDVNYPLRLNDGACRATKNVSGIKVDTFTCDDFVGAEDKILEALATHGPVAVAVNALTWQNYLGGVIQYHCSGSPAELNHAVQIIGYDLTADVPHYIAKNSWGKEFGNDGYLKLAIGNNICGLANEVATITVK